MSKVIKIYNPKDIPFGNLSNHYLHPMVIDGKRWNTVTNYILSNMLLTPLYREILQNADIKASTSVEATASKIISNIEFTTQTHLGIEDKKKIKKYSIPQNMDINDLYEYYWNREELEQLRTSVEKAYNSKISENKQLQNTLLSTGNKPIIYVSNNSQLGTGPDKNGYNIIGKILMQIRHNLRMKYNQDYEIKLENKIFNIAKAYILLEKELYKNNDIKDYLGKTPEDIIQLYLQNNPTESLDSLGLNDSQKTRIVEIYKRYPIINKEIVELLADRPGHMALSMRQQNIRKIQQRLRNKYNNTIFELYIEHLIRQNYPKIKDYKIKKATIQAIYNYGNIKDENKTSTIFERIVNLYDKGLLPQDLTDKISKALESIHIPTDEEVLQAENMKLQDIQQ